MVIKRKAIQVVAVLMVIISTAYGCLPKSLELGTTISVQRPSVNEELRAHSITNRLTLSLNPGSYILFESGYTQTGNIELTNEDYITHICVISTDGEAEYITTLSGCNVDDSVYIGDSILFIKSYVPLREDDFKGEIVAIDMYSFEELWRYSIDCDLTSIKTIGDFLLVDDCVELTDSKYMISGQRTPDLCNLKSRVLLDNNGDVVTSHFGKSIGIITTTGFVGDTFFGIAKRYPDDLNGYIFEMDKDLEVVHTFEFPEGYTQMDHLPILASEAYGAVLLTVDSIFRITENEVSKTVTASGVLKEKIINEYNHMSKLLFEREKNGKYYMVLDSKKWVSEKKALQELILVEYDIASEQISYTRLYPEIDRKKIYTLDTDGNLSALQFEGYEFKIVKWGQR